MEIVRSKTINVGHSYKTFGQPMGVKKNKAQKSSPSGPGQVESGVKLTRGQCQILIQV